jgi:CRISPR-associated exonuclease Cas4
MSVIEVVKGKNPRKISFTEFLFMGLKNADSGLGDRSKYVGASDIGGCLKKSFFSKFEKSELSLSQLLVFVRRYFAEFVIERVLKLLWRNHRQQVEICGKDDLAFIKARIDFIADSQKEAVIIECKSVTSSVETPYESWILQTQL